MFASLRWGPVRQGPTRKASPRRDVDGAGRATRHRDWIGPSGQPRAMASSHGHTHCLDDCVELTSPPRSRRRRQGSIKCARAPCRPRAERVSFVRALLFPFNDRRFFISHATSQFRGRLLVPAPSRLHRQHPRVSPGEAAGTDEKCVNFLRNPNDLWRRRELRSKAERGARRLRDEHRR